MAYDSKGTLNKVMLIGRLGSDPDLKYTNSGVAVLSMSIATNTSFKGQDGSTTENTEWHKIVAWRKLGEVIAQYAKKGSSVYVEGKLVTRSWQDKDGVKKYTTEIVAESIQLLGSKEKHTDTETSEPEYNSPEPPGGLDNEDEPF
jgi:single-strand DNA-binding protein